MSPDAPRPCRLDSPRPDPVQWDPRRRRRQQTRQVSLIVPPPGGLWGRGAPPAGRSPGRSGRATPEERRTHPGSFHAAALLAYPRPAPPPLARGDPSAVPGSPSLRPARPGPSGRLRPSEAIARPGLELWAEATPGDGPSVASAALLFLGGWFTPRRSGPSRPCAPGTAPRSSPAASRASTGAASIPGSPPGGTGRRRASRRAS
jgi:hypothetical protein